MVTGPYIVILLLLSSVGRERMSGHPPSLIHFLLYMATAKRQWTGKSLTAEKLILIIGL